MSNIKTGTVNLPTVFDYVTTITGNTIMGSNVVSNISDFTAVVPGLRVDNPNFAPGTLILSIDIGLATITLDHTAGASVTATSMDLYCPAGTWYCQNATVFNINTLFDATDVALGWLVYTTEAFATGVVHRYKVTDIVDASGPLISFFITWDEGGPEIGVPVAATDFTLSEPTPVNQIGSMISVAAYPNLAYEGFLIYNADAKKVLDSFGSGGGGSGTAIMSSYTNGTGSTIAAGTPVYLTTAGHFAKASGAAPATAICMGITASSIGAGSSGNVYLSGIVPSIGSFTNGKNLYLTATAGVMTDVIPDIGTYGAGFTIVKLGIVDGTNLILQIQSMGVL